MHLYETEEITKICALFVTGLLAVFNLYAYAAVWNSNSVEQIHTLLQNGIKRNYVVRMPPSVTLQD